MNPPYKKSLIFKHGIGGAPKQKSSRFKKNIKGFDLNTSIQVGEDAYFTRQDAMGVADGVGGWSDVKSTFF